MEKIKRQHYVWRHYLKPWTTKNKILCLRNNKIFESKLMGVAQEKYFYKLEELDKKDISIIKDLFFTNINTEYTKMNQIWIPLMNQIFEIKKIYLKSGKIDKKTEESIEVEINNLLEKLHGQIEITSIEYLKKLENEDLSFLNNEKDFIIFTYFLTVQYFRTKKMKENMLLKSKKMNLIDIKKAWNVISLISATNIAYFLYSKKSSIKFTLLKSSHITFITSDQPIINTKADYKNEKLLKEDEFELYYPITPKIALLISMNEKNITPEITKISDLRIMYYNNLMYRASHEMIFSDNQNILEDFLKIAELI